MAFPSSPPSLPEEQSFSSSPPPIPAYRLSNHKRRLEETVDLSSDPLFSEDASEAELDSGDIPRRKRLVRGPWWALSRRKSAVGLRHEVGRKGLQFADSGVWMPSDDSEQEKISADLSSDPGFPEDTQYKTTTTKPKLLGRRQDDVQDIAIKIVLCALENGKESIDLSGLALGTVASDMLRPLHQLIRLPQDYGTFRTLTPAIQLYLSGNNLTTLPTELFRLSNITVLSLRNNRLRELPSSLFRMAQLKELNVSGNELSYLPWQSLLKLQERTEYIQTCAPNPFYTLSVQGSKANTLSASGSVTQERLDAVSTAMWKHSKLGHVAAYFVSSSPISYFNNHGTPIYQRTGAFSKTIAHSGDFTPSLFELALRQAQKSHALADAISMLPSDVPEGIIHALREAATASELGNERCSTCQREMIIARAQWLEYWSDSSSFSGSLLDTCLPYMRKACSHACAKPTEIGAGIGGTSLS